MIDNKRNTETDVFMATWISPVIVSFTIITKMNTKMDKSVKILKNQIVLQGHITQSNGLQGAGLSINTKPSKLFFFWPPGTTCGISVSKPGIQCTPPAVGALEVQSFNHWTTREVPPASLLNEVFPQSSLELAFPTCPKQWITYHLFTDVSIHQLLL